LSSLGLQPGLGASTSVLLTYHFPLILGISYGLSLGVGLGLHFRTAVPWVWG